MSLPGIARYHLGVNVAGAAVLRLERTRTERAMRAPGFWKHEHLERPLSVSPRLKELISRHYLVGRYANGARKVAWVTSGAPVEILTALDIFPIYPENHGAVCGIRRTAEELCGHAEDAGYSRDLCSYARTDIGSLLSGKTPVGRLPAPDVLVCCNNICQTVLYWYQVLAKHFDVPLISIDTPFLYRDAPDHAVAFVQAQLEASIPALEQVAGRGLSYERLREVTRLSRSACELWLRILRSCTSRPAPVTAFDQFIHLAPIVEMRGQPATVDYYAAMSAELERRVEEGVGALKNERKRLLWDNLPIWFRVRWLGQLLAQRGVALVASTYTNAWAELAEMIDPERPIESSARVHLHPILNRGTGHKLATIRRMADEYSVDGVLLHSDRSCKPYSIGQLSQREALVADAGLPSLLLEADHNDPRSFSESQAVTRLEAFLEVLGA